MLHFRRERVLVALLVVVALGLAAYHHNVQGVRRESRKSIFHSRLARHRQRLQMTAQRRALHPSPLSMSVEEAPVHDAVERAPVAAMAPNLTHPQPSQSRSLNRPTVHAFYYAWYGNPTQDGKWIHWNHPVLEGKQDKIHQAPDDIGSFQYPKLGPYSSNDLAVVRQHMAWMVEAGIDVVAVSWYPPHQADEQEGYSDDIIPTLLNVAQSAGLKICLHVEPFKGRSAATMREALVYAIDRYGGHAAFFRDPRQNHRPWFYMYDSYLVADWNKLMTVQGPLTVRNTKYDSVFVGLALKTGELAHMATQGFDGIYSYFAADRFTETSTLRNWHTVALKAKQLNLLWVPCVGPGYNDESIRPWNAKNTHDREGTAYYRRAWESALSVRPSAVAITSFNEWHEGTQIEPAVAHSDRAHGRHYPPYEDPFVFLRITKVSADKLAHLFVE